MNTTIKLSVFEDFKKDIMRLTVYDQNQMFWADTWDLVDTSKFYNEKGQNLPTKKIICLLLKYWNLKLEYIKSGGCTYLPFYWYDAAFVAGFKVTKLNDSQISLEYGQIDYIPESVLYSDLPEDMPIPDDNPNNLTFTSSDNNSILLDYINFKKSIDNEMLEFCTKI